MGLTLLPAKSQVLTEKIKAMIINGNLPPGSRLLSLRKLAEDYNVSVDVVRHVFKRLEAEKMIIKRHGSGTFVNPDLTFNESEKVTSRLAGLMMTGHGHLYGELHSLMVAAIQKYHYYPVSIHIPVDIKQRRLNQDLKKHLLTLVESSPVFFAIDGMFAFPFGLLKEIAPDIRNIIFFNRFETDISFPGSYVLADYEKGGYLGGKHLLKSGVNEIIFFGSSNLKKAYSKSAAILRGIRKAFEETGKEFNPDNVFMNDKINQITALTKRFLRKKHPDAIFSSSDTSARIIQQKLEKSGLKPGVDYKLIGYNNTPWAYEFDPPLTTVAINMEDLAKEFEKLISNGNLRSEKKIMIEPRLIIRGTA